MQAKKINVRKLIEKFNLTLDNHKENIELRDIYSPSVKKLGLELAGEFVGDNYQHNVICWGNSENSYFEKIGESKAKKVLALVLQVQPPLLILSCGIKEMAKNWIVEIADKYNIPVFWSKQDTAKIMTTIGTYLNDMFSEEIQVHGCLVSIGGTGVLIVGNSGVGKSEATLELIQKGHLFISDDAVLIKHIGVHFYGTAPQITKNFIEVRGIGLIDIKYTYGIKSITDGAVIDFVAELVYPSDNVHFDRLGIDYLQYNILDGYLPKIQIPVKNGFSAASLIEAAVSTFVARKDGSSVLSQIEKRKDDIDE